MFDYFYTISNIQVFFLLAGISIFFSVVAIAILKYLIPVRMRYKDNPVIGSIGSIVGIIYGVLAGLMALYLINNTNYTSDAVQREASAAANIFRESQWLQMPTRERVQSELEKYLVTVVNTEWPLMRKGSSFSGLGDKVIDKMYEVLIHDEARDNSTELFLRQDILSEIKSLYNARQQRVLMNSTSLNIEVWMVILIGTVLTIAVNYFFKTGFGLHVLTLCAAALMASSMIFLLITLDRPFQGEFAVQPQAFQSLLVLMNGNKH